MTPKEYNAMPEGAQDEESQDEEAQEDCSMNHLCNGRFVHLPVDEQCDKCGGAQ